MNFISTVSVLALAGVEARLRGVVSLARPTYGVRPLDAAEDAVASRPGVEKRTRFLDLALDGVIGDVSSPVFPAGPTDAGLFGEITSLRRFPRRTAIGCSSSPTLSTLSTMAEDVGMNARLLCNQVE